MSDAREKPPECYNFSGIRDLLRKYRSHDGKRQLDSKNIIPSHKKNKVKPSNHAQDDIVKAIEAKKANDKDMKVQKKAGQKGNNGGVELDGKKTSIKHGDEDKDDKDYQLTSCLLKSIIVLIDSSKKKKVSSKVSDSELHDKHGTRRRKPHQKSPLRTISLDKKLFSVLLESLPSGKKSSNEKYLELDNCKPPLIDRITSKGNSKLAGFEDETNHGHRSFISRNKSIASTTKSGQIIMFSSSSGMLKPPPIEKKLECTLEELCQGCVKHIKVTRDIFTCTGKRIQQDEVIAVDVKPGSTTGTKVTFKGAINNDNSDGSYPADIVFTIIEKRHPLFQRIDDELELEIEIPLADALTGCPLTIPLLGNEKLTMEIDEIVHPGYEITIVGQGMPNQKNPRHRGDLKVKFLINFPKELTNKQRSQMYTILSG